MSFGYQVLLFTLVFLSDALNEKKWTDVVFASAGILMILLHGSRGAILCIGIFFILSLFLSLREKGYSLKRLITFSTVSILAVGVFLFYDALYRMLLVLLSNLQLSSRTISMIVNGRIQEDSGRSGIWVAARQMISDRPLGYGAFGTRHVLSSYTIAGHSHSIIYEMLIDFGVLIGGLLLLVLFYHSISIMVKRKNEWADLFIPFFCTACALFFSLSFWETKAFWVCVAIGVNYYVTNKKQKRGNKQCTTPEQIM